MQRNLLVATLVGSAFALTASSAFAQQCNQGGNKGGGQTGSPLSPQAFTQSPFGSQFGGGSQIGFTPQPMAQPARQLAAERQAYGQIAAARRQDRIEHAAYRALMAKVNRERFEALAEADEARTQAYRERNRLRMLDQGGRPNPTESEFPTSVTADR